MKAIKLLVAMPVLFVAGTYLFIHNTVATIYYSHCLWPVGIRIFSIVSQALLLYFSEWYRTLFMYWYLVAWIAYLLIPRMRRFHDSSAQMVKEVYDYAKH